MAETGRQLETAGAPGVQALILAALLAQAEYEGPEAPLEGTFGFLKVVCDEVNWQALDGEIPQRWQLQRNTYKPYPCGVVLNPVIDACIELAATPAFNERGMAAITRIEVCGHPLLRERTDRPNVNNGRQSQVSAQHAVGVVLTRQRAGLDEFSDAAVADSRIRALGAKLTFQDDPAMSIDSAGLRVEFADGVALESRVDAARGSLHKPMTDAELATKLNVLCEFGQSRVHAAPLIEALWHLESSTDASAPMTLASGVRWSM